MKYFKLSLLAVILMASNVALADLCGIGRIVEVTEGWGDKEDLQIKLSYDIAGAVEPPTGRILLPDSEDNDVTFWFKYNSDNVSADRMKRIRTLAYLALANGNPVKLISRWNGEYSCLNLSQLTIVSTVADLDS